MNCCICDCPMHYAFSCTLLGRYHVAYYQCPGCGLFKTEEPYWLEEAYKSAIADADTGLLVRNLLNQQRAAVVLQHLFKGKGRFLDLGGGYGVFTRLMRDAGFDCYTTDKYCPNLMAKGFEPSPGFKADGLFAFEVFEHIPDPRHYLEKMFARYGCRTLIFSTELYANPVPSADWWYLAKEGGQHITFYSARTLEALARVSNCRYVAMGCDFHMITDRSLSRLDIKVLGDNWIREVVAAYYRHKRRGMSRTWADHLEMCQRAQPAKS